MKNVKWFLGLIWFFASVASADYTLMINEFRGGKESARWQPLADYLTKEIGKKVNIISNKPSGIIKRSRKADFFLANPVITVKVIDAHGFKPIATLNHKTAGSTLSGQIIVRDDSPIRDLSQISGKKVAVVNKKNAAGGFIFQAYELLKAGFDPEKDFKAFWEIQNQNAIIFRVLKGQLDVGFIRTGQLNRFAKENTSLDISKIRILNKQGDSNRSTELFPHWAFSAKNSVPASVVDKVKTALMSMTPVTPASKKANIKGFVKLGDYAGFKNVMIKLKVYNFKN